MMEHREATRMSKALDVFLKQNMEIFDDLQQKILELMQENIRLKDENNMLYSRIETLLKGAKQ